MKGRSEIEVKIEQSKRKKIMKGFLWLQLHVVVNVTNIIFSPLPVNLTGKKDGGEKKRRRRRKEDGEDEVRHWKPSTKY